MYFHTGLEDYVLFKGWVPCTPRRYAVTCIAVVFLGVFVALLKAVRLRLEQRFHRQALAAAQKYSVRKPEVDGAMQAVERDSCVSESPGAAESDREGIVSARQQTRQRESAVELLLGAASSASAPGRAPGDDGGILTGFFPRSALEVQHNLVRGLLGAVILSLDYCLMFVAMTFNVGLFVAVCVGVGMGAALFGHIGGQMSVANVAMTEMLQERACCS